MLVGSQWVLTVVVWILAVIGVMVVVVVWVLVTVVGVICVVVGILVVWISSSLRLKCRVLVVHLFRAQMCVFELLLGCTPVACSPLNNSLSRLWNSWLLRLTTALLMS